MHWMMLLTTLFPIVLIGALLPTLGRQRRGLLFGVSVPLEFADSTEARSAVWRYRLGTMLLTVFVLALAGGLLVMDEVWTLTAVPMAAILVELLGGMLLWQRERRALRPHAVAVPLVRSADLAATRPLGSIVASAAALPPLVVTALWLRLHWTQIPARWPQHWNAAGVADGWGTKSPADVYLPLLLGAMVVLLLTGAGCVHRMGTGAAERAAPTGAGAAGHTHVVPLRGVCTDRAAAIAAGARS